jgi:hypothetical protein
MATRALVRLSIVTLAALVAGCGAFDPKVGPLRSELPATSSCAPEDAGESDEDAGSTSDEDAGCAAEESDGGESGDS